MVVAAAGFVVVAAAEGAAGVGFVAVAVPGAGACVAFGVPAGAACALAKGATGDRSRESAVTSATRARAAACRVRMEITLSSACLGELEANQNPFAYSVPRTPLGFDV